MKILYFLSGTGVGGIGKFVSDIVTHINNDTVEFTFVTLGNSDSELSHLLRSRGKVLNYPRWSRAVLQGLEQELSGNPYDVVHAHLGCWSFLCLYYAKRAGVKMRIAHSHSADSFKTMRGIGKVIYFLSRIINPLVVTHYMACSNHACKETFGKRVLKSSHYYRILNPVDERYFTKREASRNLRKELGIPADSRVICHVGYMGYHKNHPFILRLAQELKDENIFWLLVGDGNKRKDFEKIATEEQLNRVLFLGIRNDIPEILRSADLFILPSLLEGLGTVTLEAQACGLPCVISENVTKETDIGLNLVKQIPLADMEQWKDAVVNFAVSKPSEAAIETVFTENAVSVKSCASKLLQIYRQ